MRYLAYEFSCKMDIDITEDDEQYSIESDIPNKKIHMTVAYMCVNMPKKLRGMLQLPFKKRTVQKHGKE